MTRARITRPELVAALAVTLASASLVRPVDAQEPTVRAEVLVVLARETAGTIDPELADLPALRRPPFNGFRSMEILERPVTQLRPGRDHDITLPNGRRMRLTLLRITPDGRYQVRVSINRPQEADYLPLLTVVASPGDPFFVAGQAYQGGTLVIGIRLGETPAR